MKHYYIPTLVKHSMITVFLYKHLNESEKTEIVAVKLISKWFSTPKITSDVLFRTSFYLTYRGICGQFVGHVSQAGFGRNTLTYGHVKQRHIFHRRPAFSCCLYKF